MRILILAPRLPHAQSYSGHQMVYQRMTRLMEMGHEVGLAAFYTKEDQEFIQDLPDNLLEVETLPVPGVNRMVPGSFKSGRFREASSFFRFHSPRMARKVGEMVGRTQYDVVVAEYTAMGQYLYRNPYLPAVRKIVSCHDSPTLSSRKLMQRSDASITWARQWFEYRHMRHMEFTLYRNMDRVLTLTEEESRELLEEEPTVRISPVQPGLHSDAFKPLPDLPKEHSIIITGRYASEQAHYGTMWFLRNVWPLLSARDPELRLYVVGRDPTGDMQHLANKQERVFITGEVEDLRPYLAKSKVYVCPVLSGSGLRGKLLEAMAMELPVVTTSIAAEGIPVRMGDNVMIADTPEIMAGSIYMLLHDRAKADAIGRAARQTIEADFTWERSMKRLDRILSEVVAKRSYHLVA